MVQHYKQNLLLVRQGKDSPSRNIHLYLYVTQLLDIIIALQMDAIALRIALFYVLGVAIHPGINAPGFGWLFRMLPE